MKYNIVRKLPEKEELYEKHFVPRTIEVQPMTKPIHNSNIIRIWLQTISTYLAKKSPKFKETGTIDFL